jgi:hypothetical protein
VDDRSRPRGGQERDQQAQIGQAGKRRRSLPPGLRFGPPETIAEVAGAKPRGKYFLGKCPCCGGRQKLKIDRGKNGDTIVHCYNGCLPDDLLAHFRKLGWSLSPLASPRRPSANPKSVQRALRLISTAERRVYSEHGGGPVTYRQLAPYAGNNERTVARALRGLEHLGLIRIDRGRHYWSSPERGGRLVRPTNVYAVAQDRLFRALDPDDRKVLEGLRAARISEAVAADLTSVTKTTDTGTFASESYVSVSDIAAEASGGRGGARRGVPRRSLAVLAVCCLQLIEEQGGWRGGAMGLLAELRRIAAEWPCAQPVRMTWPRSKGGVLSWLYRVRFDLATLGVVRRSADRRTIVLGVDRAQAAVVVAEEAALGRGRR